MAKKINQALPEGLAQPEIRPGSLWRDNHGRIVTVESYRFYRVTFYREGYVHPCVQPDQRFIKEFRPVEEKQS